MRCTAAPPPLLLPPPAWASSSFSADWPATTLSATASACCSWVSPASPMPPLSWTPLRCWTTCAASWAAVWRSGALANATLLPVANASAPIAPVASLAAPPVWALMPETSCRPNAAWILARWGRAPPGPATPRAATSCMRPAEASALEAMPPLNCSPAVSGRLPGQLSADASVMSRSPPRALAPRRLRPSLLLDMTHRRTEHRVQGTRPDARSPLGCGRTPRPGGRSGRGAARAGSGGGDGPDPRCRVRTLRPVPLPGSARQVRDRDLDRQAQGAQHVTVAQRERGRVAGRRGVAVDLDGELARARHVDDPVLGHAGLGIDR